MLRIVSPYRPFPPVNHSQIGFDWIAALAMLRTTARRATQGEVVALTDMATDLPMPAFHYPTQQHRRLMLWILEVCLAYVESDDFDQDTVMLSPDTLVVGNLRPYFAGDCTILIRPGRQYAERPILNAAQWWPIHAKAKLAAFYRQALAIAEGLPRQLIRWGADCEALRHLLEPIRPGLHVRAGLRVSMRDRMTVLQSVGKGVLDEIARHQPLRPHPVPLVDFKYESKQHLPRYFAALEHAR